MTGIELIAAERRRQVEKKGWTTEHDDEYNRGELAVAAAYYAYQNDKTRGLQLMVEDKSALCTVYRDPWLWDSDRDKRKKHSRKKQLAIAGALIAAELDRLERESVKSWIELDRSENESVKNKENI